MFVFLADAPKSLSDGEESFECYGESDRTDNVLNSMSMDGSSGLVEGGTTQSSGSNSIFNIGDSGLSHGNRGGGNPEDSTLNGNRLIFGLIRG